MAKAVDIFLKGPIHVILLLLLPAFLSSTQDDHPTTVVTRQASSQINAGRQSEPKSVSEPQTAYSVFTVPGTDNMATAGAEIQSSEAQFSGSLTTAWKANISAQSQNHLAMSDVNETRDIEIIVQQSTHQTTQSSMIPTQASTTRFDNACLPPSTFTQLTGHIQWTGRKMPCAGVNFTWHIILPPEYAVTVKINTLYVGGTGKMLEFHSLNSEQSTADLSYTSKTLIRSFDENTNINSHGLDPILSYTNHMAIITSISTALEPVLFDVDYLAHPLNKMPSRQRTVYNTLIDSALKYNCTEKIPEYLRCDMIQQCMNGADERNCSYRGDGSCGDWIPYGQYCLKAFFKKYWRLAHGTPLSTHPLLAEKACKNDHGATLAKLVDKEGMALAEDMIKASGFRNAVIGLKKVKPVSTKLRHLYKYIWQWGDQGSPIAYNQNAMYRDGPLEDCAMLSVYPETLVVSIQCSLSLIVPVGYVCMRENLLQNDRKGLLRHDFLNTDVKIDRFPTKRCPDGSRVQLFHRCLWKDFDLTSPDMGWSPSNLPLFHCQYGESIHYTLACDGNPDCPDGSDELDCLRPRLSPLTDTSFVCESSQIIPSSLHCNGMPDCFDDTDEKDCATCTPGMVKCPGVGCLPSSYVYYFDTCPFGMPHLGRIYDSIPAILKLDGRGMSVLSMLMGNCSHNHFSCFNGLCIPSYLIYNGEQDCLLGEDENIAKENVTCPGYYRCQDVGLCVHGDHVCDGIHHCPNKDDERYCDLTCPDNCTCEGYAYTCREMFDPLQHLHVRYLDLSGTNQPLLDDVNAMEYLLFLNLSFCQLSNVSLQNMHMLNDLDLSFNALSVLSFINLEQLPGLITLNISGNPLLSTVDSSFTSLILKAELFMLQQLSIRHTNITSIQDRSLWPLSRLKVLDLRDNKIESFSKDVFGGLNQLQVLYSDNHKLCCPYFILSLSECYAPEDELSSCSDLLRFDVFRVFLWGFVVMAVVGNLGSLLYRLCSKTQQRTQQTSRLLVVNLCVSDFLMGVYMMVIGTADMSLRGVYVSTESEWKQSGVCKIAGFLGFVSSEVSAFVICLVTLDRFLVLCFPLKRSIHMNVLSAALACGMAWVVGISLAAVPLMAQWEFYGQSGICLPLPITRQQYQGQQYAFGVFIVLNFVLFLLIGACQILIFRSVRDASSKFGTDRRQQEFIIARRLFLIVFTDFLCWFPIGLLGLLANHGIPIPDEANVWSAIFVLPLNSALNPFLYTLNGLAERWEKQREAARMKKMLAKLHSEIPKWTPAAAEEVTRICLRSGHVRKEHVLQLLGADNCVSPQYPDRKTGCTQYETDPSVEPPSLYVTSVDSSTSHTHLM